MKIKFGPTRAKKSLEIDTEVIAAIADQSSE